MGEVGFIRMTVGGLTLDPTTKTPILILRDDANRIHLPIWIGVLEATAIATELEGVRMARPMTHDLLRTILDEFNAKVLRVLVTELRENTYLARIELESPAGILKIDARPSDAISLALRVACPIYVAESVLESSSLLPTDAMEEGGADFSAVSRDKWSEILQKMVPDDFKYRM